MAKAGGGISGIGVGMAGAGGLLIYAGLTGQQPLAALRSVLAGTPAPVPAGTGVPMTTPAGTTPAAGTGAGGTPQLAAAAQRYVGVPYRWGGSSPTGVDCSGLVQLACRDIGVTDCPRTTTEQMLWRRLYRIPRADVAAGDLVYWIGHVVIAIDNQRAVAAQHTGTVVQILPIADGHKGMPVGYFRLRAQG